MLPTLITTCKDFKGETSLHQKTAIKSWRNLGFTVLIFGDERGVKEVCEEYDCIQVTDINHSHINTPYINEMISKAKQLTQSKTLAYINSDIILPPNSKSVFSQFEHSSEVNARRLLVTRRKNVPLLNGEPDQILNNLDDLDREYGTWDLSEAIDLFLFDRDLYEKIPDFFIGHFAWDTWMLGSAHKNGATVIDATHDFHLFHPIHGYDRGWKTTFMNEATNDNAKHLEGITARSINQAATHTLKGGTTAPITEKETNYFKDLTPNPKQDFAATLFISQNCPDDVFDWTSDETFRRLLWRQEYYFPFDYKQASTEAFKQLVDTVNTKGDIEDCYHAFQDLYNRYLSAKLTECVNQGKPLAIWGTGQYSHRIERWLERTKFQIDLYIETAPKAPSHKNRPILSFDQLSKLKDKPFILLGSTFVAPIRKQLEEIGLIRDVDFIT